MLKTDTGSRHREFTASKVNTQAHLTAYQEQLHKYHSPHYLDRAKSAETTLNNHYWTWNSYVVTRCVFNDPNFKLASKATGQAEQEDAEAAEVVLNQWVEQQEMAEFLQTGPVLDAQFNWGIAMVARKDTPGMLPIEYEEEAGGVERITPQTPSLYRISQRDFGWDPQAKTQRASRFFWHRYYVDLDWAIDQARNHPEEGWRLAPLLELEAKMSSVETTEMSEYGEGTNMQIRVPRNQIPIICMWMPEAETERSADEGFHGKLFFMFEDNSEQDAREAQDFYGPPRGPYLICRLGTVPDDVAPLGPHTVAEEQIRDTNRLEAAISVSSAEFKQLIFADARQPKLNRALADAQHHWVVGIPGFDASRFGQFSFGGVDDNQIVTLGMSRDRLNTVSHMDDSMRGQARKGVTATAENRVSSSTDVRMGGMEQSINRFVVQIARTALWYIINDNEFVMELSPEAKEKLGIQPQEVFDEEGTPQYDDQGEMRMEVPPAHFRGGQAQINFEAWNLTLDADAMKYSDRGVQMAMGLEALGQVRDLMMMRAELEQNGLDVAEYVRRLGHIYNDASLADLVKGGSAPRPEVRLVAAGGSQNNAPRSGGPSLPTIGDKGGPPGSFSGNKTGGLLRKGPRMSA